MVDGSVVVVENVFAKLGHSRGRDRMKIVYEAVMEVGTPVVVDGHRLRFPFSAPDEPWRPASFDLEARTFSFDPLPGSHHEPLVTARVASFPSGAGPMPEMTVRALLHRADLGEPGCADAAFALLGEVDNPALHNRVRERLQLRSVDG